MKKRVFLNIDERKKIGEEYLQGSSSLKLAKKYNCNKKTILNILKELQIKTKSISVANRRYFVNENYFEKIDSKDKAYFLGFLVSDGCNIGNRVTLALHKNDIEILNILKGYIKSEKDIILHKDRNMCTLGINSKKISKDLEQYGVVKAKTHKTYFPDIPEEFYNHFIRGVFDGDGSIVINKRNENNTQISLSICGNIDLITKIQQILFLKCNLKKLTAFGKTKTKNIIVMIYTGNIQVNKIYQWLYQDCDDLYLKRKKEKIGKVLDGRDCSKRIRIKPGRYEKKYESSNNNI